MPVPGTLLKHGGKLDMTQRDLALTFAGGGNRTLFQAGLLNRWGERLLPKVCVIAACSAGASTIVIRLAGRQEESLQYWLSRREGIERNFTWSELLRGRRPTPHEPIFRDTMRFALEEGGFERVRAQPFPILVLAAAFPKALPQAVAIAMGFGAYSLERRLRRDQLHPSAGRRVGFEPVIVDLRHCDTIEEMVDLVLASSATPPFTRVGRFRGRPLLDGGMVDNAPAFVAETVPGIRRHLVFLSRPYPAASIGVQGARWYFAPQGPVPISRWDYTRPDLIDATIRMGENEAETRRDELERFLAYGIAP